MTAYNRREHYIAARFLPALLRLDCSGLSARDVRRLATWRSKAEVPGGHWGSVDAGGIRKCDATAETSATIEAVYLTPVIAAPR